MPANRHHGCVVLGCLDNALTSTRVDERHNSFQESDGERILNDDACAASEKLRNQLLNGVESQDEALFVKRKGRVDHADGRQARTAQAEQA